MVNKFKFLGVDNYHLKLVFDSLEVANQFLALIWIELKLMLFADHCSTAVTAL